MFEVYKKGQGTAARWVTAAALGGFAGFGSFELQRFLDERAWSARNVSLGLVQLSLSVLIGMVAFVIAAALIGLLINNKRLVDYLIASQVELRKVSWPTRPELKRQTVVVIVTILLFSVILLMADLSFMFGSSRLYGY